MRTNRSSFTSTPAGSAKALDQKPKPKRSKREINQLMLMLPYIMTIAALIFASNKAEFPSAYTIPYSRLER